MSTEKHQGNEQDWDVYRAKKQVEERLMTKMMQLFRSVVDKGEEALKAEMQKQKTEHQKRATVIRRANNLEHEEVISGKGLLVRRHLGFEKITADEFNEEYWGLMATGTRN